MPGFAHAGVWGPINFSNSQGLELTGTLTVYTDSARTIKATLYTDQTAATTAPNPVVSDTLGNFTVYAAPGLYYGTFTHGGTTSSTLIPVVPMGSANPAFNVLDYGAKADGVTDDSTAINAAITAAFPSAGVVYLPPGNYLINSAIIVQSTNAAATAPVPYPSIVGANPPGRIGDGADVSSTYLTCGASFPSGTAAVQYIAPNGTVAPSGFALKRLGIVCGSRGAGVYIEQPRMAHVADLSIDHPATISGNPNSASGGFSVVQRSGTASAYNLYEHIQVAFAGQDGICQVAASNDVMFGCYVLGAVRNCYSIQGSVRCTACHYEGGVLGWYVTGGSNAIHITDCENFGLPTSNAVQVTATGAGAVGTAPIFTGCRFQNNPGVSPGEAAGSVIRAFDNGKPIVAIFNGCQITANTNTTDWVFADSTATGTVQFNNCVFDGSPTTNKFKDTTTSMLRFRGCSGVNPVGVVSPGVPGSGSAVAAVPYDRTFYVSTVAGTTSCSMAIQSGPTVPFIASTAQVIAVRVPAGQTVTPTYTGTAPTWVVEGE